MEENGVIWLNMHADSLEKVTTVKRVARVFRDLKARLRDKRNRILVHRSMCHSCHWLKSIIIIIITFTVCDVCVRSSVVAH